MKSDYDIIKALLRTEKGTLLAGQNKYLFKVADWANKIAISRAISRIYKVGVKKVNIISMHGKKRRMRYKEGKMPDWKKAVVTLKEADKIELT